MRTILSEVGDERTRTWFAWLPVTIGNERRWLERVTVRQRCVPLPFARHDGTSFTRWRNREFVDAGETIKGHPHPPECPPYDGYQPKCGPVDVSTLKPPTGGSEIQ